MRPTSQAGVKTESGSESIPHLFKLFQTLPSFEARPADATTAEAELHVPISRTLFFYERYFGESLVCFDGSFSPSTRKGGASACVFRIRTDGRKNEHLQAFDQKVYLSVANQSVESSCLAARALAKAPCSRPPYSTRRPFQRADDGHLQVGPGPPLILEGLRTAVALNAFSTQLLVTNE